MNYKTSSHFYDKAGQPMFDAGLREAKAENYLPSITTILKIINKPALNTWQQEQILTAALDTPYQGQSRDEYINFIITESGHKSETAIDFGKRVHKAIDNYVKGLTWADMNITEDRAKIEKVFDWIKQSGITPLESEKTLVSYYGFGGTIDFIGKDENGDLVIADWKTQQCKLSEYKKSTGENGEIETPQGTFLRPKPVYYDEMILQLAACKLLLIEKEMGNPKVRLMSVIINSDPFNDSIFCKEYDDKKIEWAEKTFLACLTFYKLFHKFEGGEK
jgi:hypothetical protein